jgi:hypothetical protein
VALSSSAEQTSDLTRRLVILKKSLVAPVASLADLARVTAHATNSTDASSTPRKQQSCIDSTKHAFAMENWEDGKEKLLRELSRVYDQIGVKVAAGKAKLSR